jgi:hypothetical protein
MSHFGLGLIFELGTSPEPRLLHIVDAELVCSACGCEMLRRYWRTAAWHPWNVPRLHRLVDDVPPTITETCERCEAPIGADEVAAWVVHWGFPGGRGLIQAFARSDGARRIRLLPHAAMDAQLILAREHANLPDAVELDTLSEQDCIKVFGHALSPKYWARLALLLRGRDRLPYPEIAADLARRGLTSARVARDAEGASCGIVLPVGDGLRLCISDAVPHASLVAAECAMEPTDAVVAAEVLAQNGQPREGYPGAPDRWLGDLGPTLDGLSASAIVSFGPNGDRVETIAQRVATKFPIRVDFTREPDGVFRMHTPTATGDDAAVLDPLRIARHAARTAALPAAAVHYAMEESIHFLAGLFGEEFSDRDRPVVSGPDGTVETAPEP